MQRAGTDGSSAQATPLDTGEDADPSAMRQVADALRREILRRGDGDRFIGLETELVDRYKVSKPTFRQAAKLLQHERILIIKRGAGGGFYAQPPSAGIVSKMAAMVLSSRGATLRQVAMVSGPLTVEAIGQLAAHPDAEHRAKVAAFVSEREGFEHLPSHRERGRVIADFESLIARLCGNPALELFVEAIRAITRDPRYSEFQISQEQAAAVAHCYRQLAELISEGERELAGVIACRYVTLIAGWLPDTAARHWVD